MKGKGKDSISEFSIPWIGELIKYGVCKNEQILKWFYSMTKQPENLTEAPRGWKKPLYKCNFPFVGFSGTYVIREIVDWLFSEIQYVNELNEKKDKDKNDKLYIDSCSPLLDSQQIETAKSEFLQGFIYGYNDVNSLVSNDPFSDQRIRIKKVFDLAMRKRAESDFGGFSISGDSEEKRSLNWYKDGIVAGRFYRSWYLILENSSLFESYFKESVEVKKKTLREIASNYDAIEKLLIKMQIIEVGGELYSATAGNKGDQTGTRLSACIAALTDAKIHARIFNNKFTKKEVAEAFNYQFKTKLNYTNKGHGFEDYCNEAKGHLGPILRKT